MKTLKPIQTLKAHKQAVLQLAFSPDGSRLVTVGGAEADQLRRRRRREGVVSAVIVWNMKTFKPIKKLENDKASFVFSLAFNPGGTRLATGTIDNTVIVWNMDTFEQIKTLEGYKIDIRTLAFSPDGKWLAIGPGDNSAIALNMETLTLPIPELLTETGALTNLRVCRDSLSLKVVPITPMPAPETVWVDEALPAAEALAACAD
jgi:WD40 repeat protein